MGVRQALAIAVLVAGPLLAGCLQGDAPPVPDVGVAAAALEVGHYYAVRHAGGSLTFTLAGQGDASFELYSADDQRLGSVAFASSSGGTGLHRIDGVAAGDVVLRILTLNGTLQVQSAARPVEAFLPLLTNVERLLVIDRAPRSGVPLLPAFGLPLPGQEAADETISLFFPRAPAALRVLGNGPWTNLSVTVRNDAGVMLAAADVGFVDPDLLGSPRSLQALPGTLTPSALRAGAATAHVRAEDLGGAIVLEVETFSRVALPTTPSSGIDANVPFTYGPLAAGPQAFTVHERARTLHAWNPHGTLPAAVALFGPHDEALGVLRIPPASSVLQAVSGGGEYVAVLLAGNASLGADRTPAAFDLRPLEVQQQAAPSAVAGANGRYALANETLDGERVYALQLGSIESPPTGVLESPGLTTGCDGGRFLRVTQGSEALAVVQETSEGLRGMETLALGSLVLRGEGLQVQHDGFGDDGCNRPVVVALRYVRSL